MNGSPVARCAGRLAAVALAFGLAAAAQNTIPPRTPAPDAAKAIALARNGRCAEALRVLPALYPRIADRDQRRAAGAALVRCHIEKERFDEAVNVLRTLEHDFAGDPEVLYLAAHVYSDLSLHASHELMRTAPASPQLRELSAETLESQGRWNEAAAEYRAALAKDPQLAGIHFRIGRLLLSRPGGGDHPEAARVEFEAELKVNPDDAASEFILGELDRHAGHNVEALARFQRASKLDAAFADAWLGLGRTLVSMERGADAIAPLVTAAKLDPRNPVTHFQLAQAYRLAGRLEDARRELELHREITGRIEATDDEVRRGIQGIPDKRP